MDRRTFLKRAGIGVTAAALSGGLYSLFEAGWLSTDFQTLAVPRLPEGFRGLKVAFLSDLHHGPRTGLDYLHGVVARAADWNPDVVLLGGDYVHDSPKYIAPVFDLLKTLRSEYGTFGVLGNHDHWQSAEETRAAMRASGIVDLTNVGVVITRGPARLRLSGVGDLWEDTQNLSSALDGAKPDEATILLSHNPDFAEQMFDPRVSLMLSGHTHGGQIRVPLFGAPYVPSRYGQKYASGLVQAPAAQVFVSRGIGTIGVPLRFCCRPEINLLTLQ